ncbi:MAG: hypothetical protein SF053_13310 [Bacteroidia bacterium]|nr:hypothetical protein [Bacteroidia bacterium]
MNENLHTALIELQSALENIHHWAELLQQNQLAGADALRASAQVMEASTELIQHTDQLLKQHQGLTADLRERYLADMDNALDRYRELVAHTADLVEYLRSVNFPARLDKLDSTAAAISTQATGINDKLDRRFDQLRTDAQQASAQLAAQHQEQLGKLSSLDTRLDTQHQAQQDALAGLGARLDQQHTRMSRFFAILLLAQVGMGILLYFLLR